MKLSLAIITGNIGSGLMSRFLDHFAPFVDEIVVVRAIGGCQPDDTLETAKARGCVVGEYFNTRGLDWPHVDDFAAARNKAWEMATGDWIMWADTDDVIAPEVGAGLRKIIEQKGDSIDMVITPYCVPDQGVENPRERVVRRGIARWTQPVHECLEPIEPDKKWRTARFDAGKIVHNPGPRPPAARNGRNLRILQSVPENEMTTSLWYHLFCEHFALGNYTEGTKAAEAFLLRKDTGEVERFECMLSMSMIAKEVNDKVEWLKLAWHESPHRREPLVMLSNIAQNAGDIARAEAYLQAAVGLPIPNPAPWNLRRKMWGWQFVQEQGRVQRAKGHLSNIEFVESAHFAHADAIELNHFIRNNGKISLLHATRGRPQQAIECRSEWLSRAENPDAIEHIFACDPDDEQGPALGGFKHILQDKGGGPCGAWNIAAKIAHGEVLIQVSDDMVPPMGWDRLILEAIGDTSKPAVLRVSDGHRTDGLIVMAIVTRSWIDQQGHLFHPAFFSMYSDNWLTECAEKAGSIIEARQIVFEHRHPVFTGKAWHPTTARSNAPEHYEAGLSILNQLRTSLHAPTRAPRIVILTHDEVGTFTSRHIVPGWKAIGKVHLDFPAENENAHSGAPVQQRFLRVVRDAIADPEWNTLIIAEYDTYCRATTAPKTSLRSLHCYPYTTKEAGVYAMMSPWVLDRAAAEAFVASAGDAEVGTDKEALLDRWIGRVVADARIIPRYLPESHAHPPEGLPGAIAAGAKYLHPIKNEQTLHALLPNESKLA